MEVIQLRLGGATLPDSHPRAGSDYPLFGYLLMHEDGPILVDTGAGPGHHGIDSAYALEPVDIPASLATAGVATADVTLIINTHLHFDHIGGNRYFPGIPIVAQRREFEAATIPGFTVREWIDFEGALHQPVEGRAEVAPGVTVVPTPSHTAGHQSVLIDAGPTTMVIAGQALHDRTELTTGVSAEGLAPAVEHFPSVAARIKAMEPDRVWFSHDAEPWVP